jgi:hypothetical protein
MNDIRKIEGLDLEVGDQMEITRDGEVVCNITMTDIGLAVTADTSINPGVANLRRSPMDNLATVMHNTCPSEQDFFDWDPDAKSRVIHDAIGGEESPLAGLDLGGLLKSLGGQ